MPPDLPSLACLGKSDIHVTPLLKILATGLILNCYCFGVDHLQRDASIKLASFLNLGTRLVFIRSCGEPERAAHRWHIDLACHSMPTGFVSQGSYTGIHAQTMRRTVSLQSYNGLKLVH